MASKINDRKYAIAAAAIQLFADRGYDAVTAEQIAAEAGIGARTFFRYFPTKEHAAFPDHEDRVERFRMALQARSGTASPVDAVIEVGAVNATEYFEQPDLYRARYRLIHNEPALRDHERIADRSYELAIEEFLSKELRGTPHIDLIAPIVAASLVAAVNAVLDVWALDDAADEVSLLESAKEVVRRSARAALGSGRNVVTETHTELRPGSELVLVFSHDEQLRDQVLALIERHRPQPQ